MGDRFRNRAIVGVLLAVAVAAAVGMFAYNAGVAQGLAESGRWAATPGAPAPYVYMWRPWGFGFAFFPFFFVLLCFFLLRRLVWGGPRWGRGHYYDGVPPRFEEWHRRAHERDAATGSTPGA
jgi:hypothetical protein